MFNERALLYVHRCVRNRIFTWTMIVSAFRWIRFSWSQCDYVIAYGNTPCNRKTNQSTAMSLIQKKKSEKNFYSMLYTIGGIEKSKASKYKPMQAYRKNHANYIFEHFIYNWVGLLFVLVFKALWLIATKTERKQIDRKK